MAAAQRELEPVLYNAAGVKLHRYCAYQPGTECFRMHWHERMELLRIRSGQLHVDFGTRQGIFGAGELVIIHPNQPHCGICVQAPMEWDVIMFDVRSFYNESEICSRYLVPVFEGSTRFLPHTSQPEILACIDRIVSADAEGFRALGVTAEIYRLFYLLYEYCLQDTAAAGTFDKATKEIIAYLEQHCGEALTVDLLCSRFGYTKPYFCRRFKQSTGLSPMNYLNIFRIERACRMIRSGSGEIGEIAAECGFPDANYFSRRFKMHFGHPPSYYRGAR